MFNSTNPIEGIAGAYSIAKQLSNYKNNIMLITTHYTYLTKLAKQVPGDRFVNLKMNVKMGKKGGIRFPYKLSEGVSKQWIALDLLKKNGFDQDILLDASIVKTELLS